jgi:hypothetical protein
MTLVAADSVLTGGGNVVLVPISEARFRTGPGEVAFARAGGRRTFTLARANGDTTHFEEAAAAAAPVRVDDYTGRYVSDELDVVLTVAARDGKLLLLRRPSDTLEMSPAYADSFRAAGLGSVRFSRDEKGVVSGLSIFAGRVLDVRFRRVR